MNIIIPKDLIVPLIKVKELMVRLHQTPLGRSGNPPLGYLPGGL
jgi:hypothetical protein